MNLSQLKEQVRNILRERSVKAIQKEYSSVVDDIQKHLELYKKSKGTPDEKKHVGHLKSLGEKKKKLSAELDKAVAGLYKNAELKVDEAITNPKKSNPNDLAKTVLGWFDFYTDYIDDGGQRRRAIKSNDDVLAWFGSHPKDVKEKAYKIMLSQSKDKGQIERNFGKHLKESVNEETSFNKNISDIESAFKTIYGDKVKDVKFIKTSGLKDGLVKVDFDIPARDLKKYGIGNSNPYLNKIEKLLSKKFKQDVFLNAFTVGNGSITYDLIGESVNEGKYYVTYNRGRGQGKGLEMQSDPKTFKPTGKPKVFSSYNDAKKYAEKMEKMFRNSIGGSTAYWVSDEKMNKVEESVNESDLKGYLVADVVDDIVKSIGTRFVSGEIKQSNKNKIYLKLKDVKFGSGVVKILKSRFGIDAKEEMFGGKDKFGSIPSVSFFANKVVSESVNESTEPEVISQLRDIVKNKQYQDVKDPSSGKKMKVDMQTANIVLKIYDGLSNVNKQNMVKMGLPKMIDVSNKIISKYR
jgi:hypothetical protein